MSHSSVFGIHSGPQGLIWMATAGGLDRFDGYEIEQMGRRAILGGGRAVSSASFILTDAQGRFWVATWGDGLLLHDPKRGEVISFRHDDQDPESLADDRVQTIFEDHSGRILIGTYDGLQWFDEGRFKGPAVGGPDGLSHGRIWSLGEDREGRLWVGTGAGVDVVDPTLSRVVS
ncbi:MAG: hypothetical protein K8J08_06705 [Thermoanaerobaculia bacterium]|nr:hypothetical protein [Thermoanaerobaculia bacterium]